MIYYKYRELENIDGSLNEFTLSILTNGELYFPTPRQLNDPFEVRLLFENQYSIEEAIDYFLLTGIYKDRLVARKYFEGFYEDKFNYKAFIKSCAETRNKFYIYSLSKTRENILMWSHYSKDHTGICIGFKTHTINGHKLLKIKVNSITDDPKNNIYKKGFLLLQDVKYTESQDTLKPLNPFKYDNNDIIEYFINKTPVWNYEEESRIVLPEFATKNQLIKINQSEINSITFGTNTKDEVREEIAKIISENPLLNHVELYESKMVENTRKLKIEKIEINSLI